MNYSLKSNSHPEHSNSPGRIDGSESPSQQEMSEPPLQQTPAPEIQAPPQWPIWLENLLSIVNYNFPKGLVFFCVSCNEHRLYQEKHFREGADHHGHDWLRVYEYESCICVKSADIESLGVNTAEIQQFTGSALEAESGYFMFMFNTFGYAYKDSSKKPWMNCTHCRTRLLYVRDRTTTRFCCLECKVCRVRFMNRLVSQSGTVPQELVSQPAPMPPPYQLHLTDKSYAQMTVKGSSSESPHKSDVSVRNKATKDAGEDLDAAFHEYMALLSFRDKSKLARMFHQYGLETDSENKVFTSARRSDLEFKMEWLSEAQAVVPGTNPADVVDTTSISTDRQTTLPERGSTSKTERSIPIQGHFKGLGYNGFDENRVSEQCCRAGLDSWEKSGAIVDKHFHSADPVSVEQSATARGADQIGLPEVLYEDQLHVLLSPCEEILSSMSTTTPLVSPISSPLGSAKVLFPPKLISCADSNMVESPDPIQPECSVPTPSSFRVALPAASCRSINLWRHHTRAVTKSDRVVDGQGVENVVSELGLIPESPNDNILRKAAYLLRSFGSGIENSYLIRDGDDAPNSGIQASASSPEESGPKFFMASPEVVSYKVQGPIDFTSLKQLATTFDPKRWISEARCPSLVPKLSSAAALFCELGRSPNSSFNQSASLEQPV